MFTICNNDKIYNLDPKTIFKNTQYLPNTYIFY